jgi:hypothetical protein
MALLIAGEPLGIDPKQITSLGKFGSAGFGVVTFYFAHKQATHNGYLYVKVPKTKHDWLSLGLGLLAGTSLAKGIDTLWGLPVKFLTTIFTGLEKIQIIADLGLAAVACLIITKLYYGDYKQPTLVKWGFVLSVLLPMSGGGLTIFPNLAGYLATQVTTGFTN